MSRKRTSHVDERLSAHHVLARSRGGGSENNLVLLPVDFHMALHKLVGNLTKDETLRFLNIVLTPDGKWTWKNLRVLQEFLKKQD